MRGTRQFLTSLPLFFYIAANAGDWPQFRGPSSLGYTEEKNLPLNWSARSNVNIAWKSPLPKSDTPFSSPIVQGGRVFVTTVLNDPVEHHVLCFQVIDGKQLWDTKVEPGPWILKDLRGGYGAPTPCTDGKNVFVVFGSAVIASLDFDGKVVWRKNLEKYNFDVALGSSPVLYKDTVILDCDQAKGTSSIIAFNKADGSIKWEQLRPQFGFAHSTPTIVRVNGKPQMLVSGSNALQGLDPENGEVIWWCNAYGEASSPAFWGNLVFSDSGRGGKGVGVDATGRGDVTKTHVKWIFPQIPEGLSSPVIVRDFILRTHNPETLKCIHTRDGKLVFNERLPGISTWATPFVSADGRIYFASAGTSYVAKFNADDVFVVLAENDIGEDNHSSAAVSDGKIFLRGGKNLYCVAKNL
jgi:outer membrane protein assembly factor BamB